MPKQAKQTNTIPLSPGALGEPTDPAAAELAQVLMAPQSVPADATAIDDTRIRQRAALYKERFMAANPGLAAQMMGFPKLAPGERVIGTPPMDSSKLDAFLMELAMEHEGMTERV